MVLKTHGFNYEPCLNTIVADGLPHEKIEITLAAQADITPMKCLYPSTPASGLFDLASDNYGGGDGEHALFMSEIPVDYPGRSQYDKTTAYAASSVNVPALKCKIGRLYHVATAADLTAEHEGLFLKCGADGVVDEPAVAANTTPDTLGFGFSLVEAVSTSEAVVEFTGLAWYDDSA